MRLLPFKWLLLTGIALFINIRAEGQEMPPANVNIVEARLESMTPIAWASGTVVSPNNSNIAAEVSGRLIWTAELGAKVKKGDVIARIDDTRLAIQLDEYEAVVTSARSRLAFQEGEVKRQSSLAKRNLSATNDLDEAVSLRDIAKGDLDAAIARLAQTRQDIKYTQLLAPFDGLVVERLKSHGEYINDGTAIIRLVEIDNLEASLFAPLTAYRFVQQVDSLQIESPLGKGTAPIKGVIPVADSRSHLMEVRLDLSAFDWPVGLSMKAAVVSGKVKETIAVPRDALILRREGTFVFRIKKDNTAEQVPVTIGLASGERVEIIGNVNEGDKIVVRGAERLQPGQTVSIKQSNSNLISGKQ